MESTQVVIIGGGATGAGILWDLALRGIPALLLEQADIANGATGRCHGLLHSGGRYVVKDQETARDCLAENRIVKAIAPNCVEDTGGLFVQLPGDDPAFFERWWDSQPPPERRRGSRPGAESCRKHSGRLHLSRCARGRLSPGAGQH